MALGPMSAVWGQRGSKHSAPLRAARAAVCCWHYITCRYHKMTVSRGQIQGIQLTIKMCWQSLCCLSTAAGLSLGLAGTTYLCKSYLYLSQRVHAHMCL
jgi:hypothetical protein